MFESLRSINIQSHLDTLLELSKGTNFIIGTSDGGKSAIQRGFDWLRRNRPTKGIQSWFNWGANDKKDSMEFIATTDDGWSVERIRNKKENKYQIRDPDGGIPPELDFGAIKSNVPSEVDHILNLKDYNIVGQDDPYYMLQDTPGEVAKKLNDLVGLSIIDDHRAMAKSLIGEYRGNIASYKLQIKEFKGDLEDYFDADDLVAAVGDLIKLIEETDRIKGEAEELSGLINEKRKLESKLEELRVWEEIGEKVEPIISVINERDEVILQHDQLSDLISDRNRIQEVLENKRQKRLALAEVITDKLKELNNCPMCGGSIKSGKDVREHIKEWVGI